MAGQSDAAIVSGPKDHQDELSETGPPLRDNQTPVAITSNDHIKY